MKKKVTITVEDTRSKQFRKKDNDFKVVTLKNTCEFQIGAYISEQKFLELNRKPDYTLIVR